MALDKDGKGALFRPLVMGVRPTATGFCCREEMGRQRGQVEFTSMEQVGQWMENCKNESSGLGGSG